jgi:hypothetical protein
VRSDPAFLLAFSYEHLVYEINALYSTWAMMARMSTDGGDAWQTSIRNSFVEVSTLHARILQQFLYRDRPPREDDALAVHFFERPEDWVGIRPAPSAHLSALGGRVGKEIAHLTYARMDLSPEEKSWNFLPTSNELMGTLDLFVRSAMPQRLHPQVKLSLEQWKEITGYNALKRGALQDR